MPACEAPRYRCALITGAASGIGAAFAEYLPPATDLVLTGRRAEALAAAATRLVSGGRRVLTLTGDLASDADRRRIAAAALGAAVDLFICNAGGGVHGRFVDNDKAAELAALAVNVTAPVDLLARLLPAMIARARAERRRAGIVIVASTAAFGPAPLLASYAAAKAFQLRLAEGLAAEQRGEPIDILAVCPRRTRTAWFARAGAPEPAGAMAPAIVAREAMAALGRRTVAIAGPLNSPFQLMLARNPLLRQIWDLARQPAQRRRAALGAWRSPDLTESFRPPK